MELERGGHCRRRGKKVYYYYVAGSKTGGSARGWRRACHDPTRPDPTRRLHGFRPHSSLGCQPRTGTGTGAGGRSRAFLPTDPTHRERRPPAHPSPVAADQIVGGLPPANASNRSRRRRSDGVMHGQLVPQLLNAHLHNRDGGRPILRHVVVVGHLPPLGGEQQQQQQLRGR